MNKQINLRLPEKTLQSAQEYAKKNGFGTVQDFIEETVREKLFADVSVKEMKMIKALIALSDKKNLFGTEKELFDKLKG